MVLFGASSKPRFSEKTSNQMALRPIRVNAATHWRQEFKRCAKHQNDEALLCTLDEGSIIYFVLYPKELTDASRADKSPSLSLLDVILPRICLLVSMLPRYHASIRHLRSIIQELMYLLWHLIPRSWSVSLWSHLQRSYLLNFLSYVTPRHHFRSTIHVYYALLRFNCV